MKSSSKAYLKVSVGSVTIFALLCMLVAQSCPTLCNFMDCNQPDSSVSGILQARVLEWAAIPFSRLPHHCTDSKTPGATNALLFYVQKRKQKCNQTTTR